MCDAIFFVLRCMVWLGSLTSVLWIEVGVQKGFRLFGSKKNWGFLPTSKKTIWVVTLDSLHEKLHILRDHTIIYSTSEQHIVIEKIYLLISKDTKIDKLLATATRVLANTRTKSCSKKNKTSAKKRTSLTSRSNLTFF